MSLLRACLFIAVAGAACGCSVRLSADSRSLATAGAAATSSGASISVSTGSALGSVILVGAMLGDGARYYGGGPEGSRVPPGDAPPPDPARRIEVRDCTRPAAGDGGNLMCR